MADVNVRSDAVDVEQVMRQIRARIREKRGADYTEAELQQLATVKLEKFLDPRGLRSDLVEAFRQQQVANPPPPNYEFGEETLYETHRGFLRTLRRLLNPILKLFFNPDRITTALHIQSQINDRVRIHEQHMVLYYELAHNLTVEATRLGIEVHNLKMRVESLSSRLDFSERRARSLESAVQYRAETRQPSPSRGDRQSDRQGDRQNDRQADRQSDRQEPSAAQGDDTAAAGEARTAPGTGSAGQGQGQGERRRRRRRRRRRPGQTAADGHAQGAATGGHAGGSMEPENADGEGPAADDGFDAGDDSDSSEPSGQ